MKEQTSVRTPHRRLRASLWKSSSLLAVALAAVALSGCAETITGLSVAYARGNLETVVPVDFQATRLAAEQSLDNMDVHLTRNELKREKAVLAVGNTEGSVFVCQSPGSSVRVPSGSKFSSEEFAGPHPAGTAGVHIHFLMPVSRKRSVSEMLAAMSSSIAIRSAVLRL